MLAGNKLPLFESTAAAIALDRSSQTNPWIEFVTMSLRLSILDSVYSV